MFVLQESFKKSNALKRNVESCAILELCLVKFEKEPHFWLWNGTFLHILLSTLNGQTTRSKILLVELESFYESNASNRNEKSCAVLQLCLVQFKKKACFQLKNDTFLYILISNLNG